MEIQKNFKSCCFHELKFDNLSLRSLYETLFARKIKKKKQLKNGSDLSDTKLQVRVAKISAGCDKRSMTVPTKQISKKYIRHT